MNTGGNFLRNELMFAVWTKLLPIGNLISCQKLGQPISIFSLQYDEDTNLGNQLLWLCSESIMMGSFFCQVTLKWSWLEWSCLKNTSSYSKYLIFNFCVLLGDNRTLIYCVWKFTSHSIFIYESEIREIDQFHRVFEKKVFWSHILHPKRYATQWHHEA